jgi:mRNA interferase YafQ
MSCQILWTTQFRKDYNLAEKRGLNITLLDYCIRTLSTGKKLPPEFRVHNLSGRWSGYHECHIQPDWLLIYRIDVNNSILVLVRTGSHRDLFWPCRYLVHKVPYYL